MIKAIKAKNDESAALAAIEKSTTGLCVCSPALVGT